MKILNSLTFMISGTSGEESWESESSSRRLENFFFKYRFKRVILEGISFLL